MLKQQLVCDICYGQEKLKEAKSINLDFSGSDSEIFTGSWTIELCDMHTAELSSHLAEFLKVARSKRRTKRVQKSRKRTVAKKEWSEI